jgi:hypothetical protein
MRRDSGLFAGGVYSAEVMRLKTAGICGMAQNATTLKSLHIKPSALSPQLHADLAGKFVKTGMLASKSKRP